MCASPARRSCRAVLVCLLGILLRVGQAAAQSPLATQNVSASLETAAGAFASNSPWVGAQTTLRFGGTDEFADRFLISGALLYELDIGIDAFHLPVMGNISSVTQGLVPDTAQSTPDDSKDLIDQVLLQPQGIHVGVYPAWEAVVKDPFMLTVHAGAAYKLNGFKQDGVADAVYLDQGRFSVGVEGIIGKRDNGRSVMSIGVTHTISVFSKDVFASLFEDQIGSLKAYEFTVVLPISDGIGFLFEGLVADGDRNAVRVGLITAAQTGG